MNLNALVLLFAKISLVFTFIVVIAGSVVRMTGSGMGCPDWPKCFGYLIPPTSVEALTFSSESNYDKGSMIIKNDTLWVANESISGGSMINLNQWHKYPKHDYAVFNPLHTWVEYINRLATVVYAIPIVILSFLALLLLIQQKDKVTFFLALFTDIMIAYEIWLGKLVVDGNLKENSITYHMFGSIAIVSLLLMMVYRHRKIKTVVTVNKTFRVLLLTLLVMCIVQILMGTQVREDVDVVARGMDDRSLWIDQLNITFYVHRSFSILIAIATFALWRMNRRVHDSISQVNGIVVLVLLEILVGVILNYADMPRQMQPLHLLFGIILFAFTFYAMIIASGKKALK